MKNCWRYFILIAFWRVGYGQARFTNLTDSLPDRPFVGFLSKALVDMNGDGYDDIIRYHSRTKALSLIIGDGKGSFRQVMNKAQSRETISTSVADVNNDGRPDVLTGGFFNGITIWRNQGDASFAMDSIPRPKLWMQGANLADIDNDGWLDYFACNDVGLNQIWRNDGKGGFLTVTDWIDMRTMPSSDNSGTYGSVWSDIDNDGDLDLYLAKCSMYAMGSQNESDPRRINQLFINHTYDRINGQIVKNKQDFTLNPVGWFTEEAAGHGVKISGQSWTADFADIDNDGDQDLLVTNHEWPTMLLVNDGTGHFTDITASSGLTDIVEPLQGLMRDFDNDGYVDILFAGDMRAQLWHNNGNRTFTKTEPLGTIKTTSFSVGDVNGDGFWDVYTSHYPKADAEDELWVNQGNENHFMGFRLEGRSSNRSGVGAKVRVELGEGTRRVVEVRSGESYGISNSLTTLVGLGAETKVNRVKVHWPSGQQSELLNPLIDRFLTVTEPVCVAEGCIPVYVQLQKQ